MKKINLWRTVVQGCTLSLITVSLSMCTLKPTWTAEEEALITESPDTKMRLWTVDNETDSLFLRRKSLPLTKQDIDSPIFQQLKQRMLLTVTDPENEGVGIAAPQVGISRQLVAVQRMDKEGTPFEFYANPRLAYLSDEKKNGWEGCLSVPGERGEVPRSAWIVVEYNDLSDYTLHRDTIKGFTAVIFQHEIDHLDGTLYIDKAERMR